MDLLKKVIDINLLFFNNKFLILNKFFDVLDLFDPRHHLWAILTPSFMFRQVTTDTTSFNMRINTWFCVLCQKGGYVAVGADGADGILS